VDDAGGRRLVLALDTSTRVPLVVAGSARMVASSLEGPSGLGPQHGKMVVPYLRDVIRASGLRRDAIACLAVGMGPGSFTGIRIGLTAMKGLAIAWDLPLVGVDSLDVLAQSVEGAPDRFVVAVDAQRGDCQVAEFSEVERIGATTLKPWAELEREGWPPIYSPDADRVRRVDPSAPGELPRLVRPTALGLLVEAEKGWREGRLVDPWVSEPNYSRRSAAEDNRAGD
jgi:tRNA threonylcarbamoyladenosine biosynthesis protein TsaB